MSMMIDESWRNRQARGIDRAGGALR